MQISETDFCFFTKVRQVENFGNEDIFDNFDKHTDYKNAFLDTPVSMNKLTPMRPLTWTALFNNSQPPCVSIPLQNHV